MSGVWGNRIKYSIFGESHGAMIGIVISGLPAGISLDMKMIEKEMERRAPGRNAYSTPRRENDMPKIVSGCVNSVTTGAPLTAIIENSNQHSEDYKDTANIPRPGHADYTAWIKYGGHADMRGGGHFSGRLTALLVFAGAIAQQILKKNGVKICSHIFAIGGCHSEYLISAVHPEQDDLDKIRDKEFPVAVDRDGEKMLEVILKAKEKGDSVGGIIETIATGIPAGIGDPFFDSLESVIASLVFSIPAVKGVEFGDGFSLAKLPGSVSNDTFSVHTNTGEINCLTNHNGGILGGISNGMPLVFRTVIKATPSIAMRQSSVDLLSNENVELKITGRHDPCIVPRAVPVLDAITAMAVLDAGSDYFFRERSNG